MKSKLFSPELKKGSIELLILSLVEARPRHGYEIGKLIEARSGGELLFRISSLYPTLAGMEKKGWIKGRWVEKVGQSLLYFCRNRITSEDVPLIIEDVDPGLPKTFTDQLDDRFVSRVMT